MVNFHCFTIRNYSSCECVLFFTLPTLEELAINQELSDNFVVDLRNYMPIGSIINFGLYQIPPQPKKIKQWVITQGKKKANNFKEFEKKTYLKFYFHFNS